MSREHENQLEDPNLKKILEEHEKIINKNKRYIDTFFKKKAIDKIDLERKRTFSNQKQRMTGSSFRSNESMVSKKSNQSIRSNQTSISNRSIRSTDSSKGKLTMVR